MTNAPTGGGFEITVTFNETGSTRLAEITSANIGKRLAMIFDGKVLSAPFIMSQIHGKAVITGNLSAAEAGAIVKTLTRAQEASGGSKPLLLDVDMAQDVVKDLRLDGTIRFKITITQRNRTSRPLQTVWFSNSDSIHVDKLADAQGRTIPFSTTRAGKMTSRYEATLAEPIKPGAEYSYTMEGTEAGLVKPLPQPGEFEYTMRHWPGTIRTRRVERHLLPPGTQLLSKEPADLTEHTRDGRVELFIDRLIPSGDSLEIRYAYRLPAK
jgi:hypothetical protein